MPIEQNRATSEGDASDMSVAAAENPEVQAVNSLEAEPTSASLPPTTPSTTTTPGVTVAPQTATASVATPVAPVAAPVASAKRSKIPYILAVVGAVLLVGLIGGGAYAYNQYQKPENILLDAAAKAIRAKQSRTKTTVASDFSYSSGDTTIALNKIVFENGQEQTPRIDANAEIDITYNGKAIQLTGDVLATDAGVVYYRVNNLKDTITKIFPAAEQPSAQAMSYLSTIDGKWAKYSIDDLKGTNPEAGKTVQCVLDVYKKHKDGTKQMQELVDVYKANQFVVAQNNPKLKNGNYELVVNFDKSKYKAFEKASEETEIAKEVNACDASSTATDKFDSVDADSSDTATSSDEPVVTTTVSVSQFDHILRAIDIKVTYIKSDDKTYTITSHTDVDFKTGVTTDAPSSPMSTDDWTKNVQSFYTSLYTSSYQSSYLNTTATSV